MSIVFDPDFPELKRRIVARTGHFYFEDKDDMLAERAQRRLRETGVAEIAAYLALLDDALDGEAEWRALEGELTIGETFFFRYAEQFQALKDIVLPELIAAKAEDKRLRIWSAGCATGAEPYSLAILLREVLGEAFADWRLSIIGTDINDSFLATAREAQFTAWALRTLGPEERARYFEGGGNSFRLRPRYRSTVRFERHNLLSLLDGTSPLEMDEFDLILCRNVLIYFHPDTVNGVVAGLAQRLLPGGWLLLGHAEPNPSFAETMHAVSLPGTVAYRPRGENVAPPPAPVYGPLPLDMPAVVPTPEPLRFLAQAPAAPRPLPDAAPQPQPTEADVLVRHDGLRKLADGGQYAALGAACTAALAQNPTDAVLHLYAALAADAQGQTALAERHFRSALYLRGNFVMAHYHLGLHLLAAGKIAPARRSIINAVEIAETLAPDCILSEGGGMTAHDLIAVARVQLDPPHSPPGRRR